MINLLPPDQQKEIRAARNNTLLLRYVILLFSALGFLLVALAITYFSLSQAGSQADETRMRNEERASGYASAQSTASQLRNDLSSAKSLFDDEIRFSLVVVRLSSLLPEGSAIDSLQIDSDSFLQPTTLSVQIDSRAAAEALQNNFASSPYVSNVSLGNISTNSGSSYPYTVQLQFTFTRSAGQ